MTTKEYRGGPYAFKPSLVMGRVNSVTGTSATIEVRSNYWPVSMTVTGEAITQEFTSSTPVAVDFLAPGTYTAVLSDAGAVGPDSGADSFSVVIPA